MTKSQKKLWIGLFVLALLSPLGVMLPEKFKAGGAWGEWGPEELEKLIGYVPEGLKKLSALWKAPIPDYNFGGEGASITVQVISYIASAILGILAVAVVVYVISKLIAKNEK
ncbi:MAG TPA: PDGLE domain-containing protein [Thermodesulfovibrionales bacterium]|nr:PDGLE domain-containing protein [Thermodesulfovibrionales bacterium]